MTEKRGILGFSNREKSKSKRVSWGRDILTSNEFEEAISKDGERDPVNAANDDDDYFDKIRSFAQDQRQGSGSGNQNPIGQKENIVGMGGKRVYSSNRKVSMADEVKEDFEMIIQKSLQDSDAKNQILHSKHKIEMLNLSDSKYNERNPLEGPILELPSMENNTGGSDSHQNQDSEKKENNAGLDDFGRFVGVDEDSNFIKRIEVEQKWVPRQDPTAQSTIDSELQTKKPRTSNRFLHFLNMGEEPDSLTIIPEINILPNEQDKPVSKLDEEPSHPHIEPVILEEPKPPKLDFESKQRSRQSYFPDKLITRVKTEGDDIESSPMDPLELLIRDMKGPLLNMYNSGISTGGINLSNYLMDTSSDLEASLSEALSRQYERVKSVRIETIQDHLSQDQQQYSQSQILDMFPDKKDSREGMVYEMVAERLALCMKVANRIDTFQSILKELDTKLEELEDCEREVDAIDVARKKEEPGPASDPEMLLRPLAKIHGFQYLKVSRQLDSADIAITFAIEESLFFNLVFTRHDSETNQFSFVSGVCRAAPALIKNHLSEVNPLCRTEVLASLFTHFIASSSNDSRPVDCLHFLAFIGHECRYLTSVRKCLGLILSRHKVSDSTVNASKFTLNFLLFPRMSQYKCTLKITVSLMLGDKRRISVEVLSSTFRKKNTKEQTFFDLNARIEEILGGVDTRKKHWLFDNVDRLAKIFVENEQLDN